MIDFRQGIGMTSARTRDRLVQRLRDQGRVEHHHDSSDSHYPEQDGREVNAVREHDEHSVPSHDAGVDQELRIARGALVDLGEGHGCVVQT